MATTSIRLRRLSTVAVAIALSSGVGLRDPSLSSSDRGASSLESVRRKIADSNGVVPSRAVQESALIGSSAVNPLDILVVGGGATGCGVALDAATRGLRVGLVEREDFSSGTSSRSTKLLHGGLFLKLFISRIAFCLYFHLYLYLLDQCIDVCIRLANLVGLV